jgi:hypothetical protein
MPGLSTCLCPARSQLDALRASSGEETRRETGEGDRRPASEPASASAPESVADRACHGEARGEAESQSLLDGQLTIRNPWKKYMQGACAETREACVPH